jgi:hypothetical protein
MACSDIPIDGRRVNVDSALLPEHLTGMDSRSVAASDQQAWPPRRTLRRRIAPLPPSWRRTGGIALVCYAIVVVFGVTYGIVRLASSGTSVSVAVVWGICAAGPLALAFVWERLSGFKVFGVEVTLAQAVVPVDSTLAAALSEQQYFSGEPEIFGLMDKVIGNPDIELLEINLRATGYWWSTRLYLQAALVEDYTNIQRLVFVDREAERRYVGMARPSEVRKALGQPPGLNLELAYLEIQNKVRQNLGAPDHTEARQIIYNWTVHSFNKDEQPVNEEMAKTSMPTGLLIQQVALERGSVECYCLSLDSTLLQTLVLEKGTHFVPLTKNGKLDMVVNCEAFTRRLATQALRARLR